MIAALAFAAVLMTPPPQQLPEISVRAPKATLTLQVATTEEQRELGLMSVTNLPPHTGMIFVFDEDQRVEFWMKDTLVPLDMVFVAADGTVRSVAAKVPVVPLDTPDEKIPRRQGDGKFVLELPAGEARRDGIAAGTRLRIVLPTPQPQAHRDGPLRCSVATSNPDASPPAAAGGPAPPGSAQSDLDVTGNFQSDFGFAAAFTLPHAPDNTGLFYSNWLLLKELHGSGAFVQLELMRWKKYAYRNEIALSWALPDGALVYRDTGIFLDDAPHELAIAVNGGVIHMSVDGAAVCSAQTNAFFTRTHALYFQAGTEVDAPGDRPAGTVARLRVKEDGGAWKPAQIRCVYRGYGLGWHDNGDGSFTAEGTYDPRKPYLRFTGADETAPCVL